MLKNLPAVLLLLCLITLGCSNAQNTKTDFDILGLKIGMSNDAAHKRLNEIGKLEREESKQQEIWLLNDDRHYSHLILAFDKEKRDVRFITAKARENGIRLRYSDVLDIGKAKLISSQTSYKYVQEIDGNGSAPGCTKIASGKNSEYLTYFSLKESNLSAEESEEDEEN